MDITQTTAPRSDQQNYDDYISGPKTVTITEVTQGTAEQPVDFHLAEFPGRPYKPSKSMRRVIVAAWGPETSEYAGRRMTLYGDATVKFGGATVGGIKISHLSAIDKPLTVNLTVTRGKRAPHTVQPLVESAAPATDIEARKSKAVAWFAAKSVNQAQLEAHVGKPVAKWTAVDLDALMGERDALVAEAQDGDQE